MHIRPGIEGRWGAWEPGLLTPGQLLELRQPALPRLEIRRQVLLLLEPLRRLQIDATVQGLRLKPCGFVRRIAADGAPTERAQGREQRAAYASTATRPNS